jgi:hypothetical protein
MPDSRSRGGGSGGSSHDDDDDDEFRDLDVRLDVLVSVPCL